MKRTFTFIVPCLNEQGNVADTVAEIEAASADRFSEHELLLVNDGSTDRTGSIMDELAATHPHHRVVHNPRNLGLGAAYQIGVKLARHEHVMMVPGDNCFPAASIASMLDKVGQADIVVPYTTNTEARFWGRRWLSAAYTAILNALFGLRLSYYNGTVIHRTALLRTVPMTTESFAYQAEILIRLIRGGASYVEVGVRMTERVAGRSAALRWKNIASVFGTVARLLWETYGPSGL